MSNMQPDSPFVELDYKFRDEPRKYKIRLVSVPSNLGTGKVWYFLCPHIGKRCRTLYSFGGWFLHREAFKGVYYVSQIRSRSVRNYDKIVGPPPWRIRELRDEINKPYFKPYYNGQPTKRYARIQKKLEQSERVSIEDLKRAVAGIL